MVLRYNNPKKCEKIPEELPVKNYLLLFSHYAAAHTGICIEYQITKEFLQIIKESLQKKMSYTEVSYKNEALTQSIPGSFAVKNKQWEYEHEARFVAFGKECTYPYTKGVKITKILFGLNTSDQNKERLYKIMKKQENIEFMEEQGIRFFEARKAKEPLLNIDFVEYLPQENQK